MIRKYVLFSFLCFLFACSSTKIKGKTKILKELNIKEVEQKFKKFTVKIPDSWYSYSGIHKILTHSPKILKKKYKDVYNYTAVTTFSSSANNETLKSMLDKKLMNLNAVFDKLKYSIHKMEHKEYGYYFILKYRSNYSNSKNYVDFIFLYKDAFYSIGFSSIDYYYYDFISDFEKMVKSFKIKE